MRPKIRHASSSLRIGRKYTWALSAADGEVGGFGADGEEERLHAANDFQELLGEIGGFVEVLSEVVERGLDVLPAADAEGLFETAFVELPIKVVVDLRLAAGESGEDGEAVGIFRGGLVREFGAGGHHVPEGEGMVRDLTGLDPGGPAGQEGDADAACGEAALDATQGVGGLEVLGVVPPSWWGSF